MSLRVDSAVAVNLRKATAEDEPISVLALSKSDVKPPERIVDPILPVGLTLLVSPPKIGKSFLAGNLAFCVAEGLPMFGRFRCPRRNVLFFDLEQNSAYAKERWAAISEYQPAGVFLKFDLPRLDRGGLDALKGFLDRNEYGLVIIDVLSLIWPISGSKANAYYAEYETLSTLHRLANDRSIAIVAVHHTNRTQNDDSFARVSGTNAMTGAVGAVWLLSRKRGGSTGSLEVSGRHVPYTLLDLDWNPSLGGWSAAR